MPLPADASADTPTPEVNQSATWAEPMRRALELARIAGEVGDVPVGAIVLGPDGSVIGAAGNAREADGDPTAHAELLAIRQASRAIGHWRLHGCTLVVTLEPCAMCAGALVLARVDRLVFGAVDPKAGAVGSLYDIPSDPRLNHRPDVLGGVLADESSALLRAFFAGRRRRRPEVPPAHGSDSAQRPPVR